MQEYIAEICSKTCKASILGQPEIADNSKVACWCISDDTLHASKILQTTAAAASQETSIIRLGLGLGQEERPR
jgi:hypothetical protein